MLLFIKKIKLILICFNFVYFIRMFTFKTRQEHACKMKNNFKSFVIPWFEKQCILNKSGNSYQRRYHYI